MVQETSFFVVSLGPENKCENACLKRLKRRLADIFYLDLLLSNEKSLLKILMSSVFLVTSDIQFAHYNNIFFILTGKNSNILRGRGKMLIA